MFLRLKNLMNKLHVYPNNNLSKCNIGYSYNETDGTNDIYTAIPNGSIVWFNINGNTKVGQELGLSQQYEGAEIIIWKGSDWRGGALAIGGNGSPVMIGQNNGSNSIKWNPLVLKSDVWPQNPGTKIAAGTDMQTITTPGHYYCENNNTTASLKNCPISDAFTLVVYRSAGGTGDNIYYVAQEYTSYLCNRRVIQTYNKDSKNWTTHEIQFKS